VTQDTAAPPEAPETPTAVADADLTTATLPTTAGKLASIADDHIELAIPDSGYRLHLVADSPINANVGDRVTGTIHVRAKRVDITGTGGRFIEPIYGRPRRLQGRIVGGSVADNRIFVACGATVIVTFTDSRQNADDFAIGQIVGFDIECGATFEPV